MCKVSKAIPLVSLNICYIKSVLGLLPYCEGEVYLSQSHKELS
jgi:hypothetical protein